MIFFFFSRCLDAVIIIIIIGKEKKPFGWFYIVKTYKK